MSLPNALKKSSELVNSINDAVRGVTFPASDRARLSAALMDQVYEHHDSIRLLFNKSWIGSAFALTRITFETAVRSIWLFRCANDYEVEQFKGDRLNKSLGNIIAEVESAIEWSGSPLSEVKRKYWTSMCSYAHSGYLQAVRRISPTDIGPNYSEKEQMEVLSFADFCLLLVSVELCALCNRDDIATRIAGMASMSP